MSERRAPATEYRKAALANVELGLGYLSEGQISRAKVKLIRAIQLAPHIAEPHSAMAYFLEQVGDFEAARQSYKKAVRLAVQKGAVYNNYGAFLCRQGRLKEADRAFQQALEDKEYPYTAEIYENAGLCAIKVPNIRLAEAYLIQAVQQNPKKVQALLELTHIYIQQGKLDNAKHRLAHYQHYAAPNARSVWLALQLANALSDRNAVQLNSQILKNQFPDSREYREFLKSRLGHV